MRPDLHTAFDKVKKFVITPKKSQWTVHFLEPICDLGNLYHNVPINLNPSISPMFLLTRFAWAIFPRLGAFLKIYSAKVVKVVVKEDGRTTERVKTLSKEDLAALLDPSKASRTPSPQKQSKRKASNQDDTLDGCERGRSNVDRGRRRRRNSSIQTPSVADTTDLEDGDNLKAMKRRYLLSQRPRDERLICCDYNDAERANRLGLPGKPENGGAHLCLEYLGLEYRDDGSAY